jgi:hypothetical protein
VEHFQGPAQGSSLAGNVSHLCPDVPVYRLVGLRLEVVASKEGVEQDAFIILLPADASGAVTYRGQYVRCVDDVDEVVLPPIAGYYCQQPLCLRHPFSGLVWSLKLVVPYGLPCSKLGHGFPTSRVPLTLFRVLYIKHPFH